MPTNREKSKRYVEMLSGKFVAPDGRGSHVPTGIATAEFSNETDALVFIDELNSLQTPCNSNFLDFDGPVVYFNENLLGEKLLR
jgi:hypothetical protein